MSMRISTSMIFNAGINAIDQQTASLLHVQQQIAASKRILTPSDDPVAAAQALGVQQSLDINAQYTTDQSSAGSALGLESSQLSSVNDLLTQVKQLAVQANSGSISASDRKSIAAQLRSDYDQLLGIANSTDGTGQYIFSGFKGSTQPFAGTVNQLNTSATTDITYSGDQGQRTMQISASRQIPVSDAGDMVFGRIPTGNGYLVTGYNTSNTGSGRIVASSITNVTNWNSAANSKNLEVRFFNQAAGVTTSGQAIGSAVFPSNGLTLGPTNNSFNISVDGGATTQVNVGQTTYASTTDLVTAVQTALNTALGGGVATASTVTVNGGTQVVITSNTTGAGSSVALSPVGGNSGLTTLFGTPVSTAGVTTVGGTYYDLVDASTGNSLFTGTASTTTGPGQTTYTHPYTAGQGIPFANLAPPYSDFGASVTITGTPSSGDSFFVKASATQSVFKTIASLVGTLENANTTTSAGAAQYASDVGSAIANIDQATNSILTTQTAIGSRQAEVTSTGNVTASVKLQYQKDLSNLQDLNMAQAISQYTQNQTGLQAAQQSFAKITQLSLFNYL